MFEEIKTKIAISKLKTPLRQICSVKMSCPLSSGVSEVWVYSYWSGLRRYVRSRRRAVCQAPFISSSSSSSLKICSSGVVLSFVSSSDCRPLFLLSVFSDRLYALLLPDPTSLYPILLKIPCQNSCHLKLGGRRVSWVIVQYFNRNNRYLANLWKYYRTKIDRLIWLSPFHKSVAGHSLKITRNLSN